MEPFFFFFPNFFYFVLRKRKFLNHIRVALLFVSSNNPDFFKVASNHMNLVYDEGERLNLLDTRHFTHLPCITFSTGIHSDYHKISDDEDAILYAGMCQQFMLYQTMIANISMKELKK